jgi:hypothetical protein
MPLFKQLNGDILSVDTVEEEEEKYVQLLSIALGVRPDRVKIVPTGHEEYLLFIEDDRIVTVEVKASDISVESYINENNPFLRVCKHASVLSLFLPRILGLPDLFANPHPLVVETILGQKESLLAHPDHSVLYSNPHDQIVEWLLSMRRAGKDYLYEMSQNSNPRMLDEVLRVMIESRGEELNLSRKIYHHTYPPMICHLFREHVEDYHILPTVIPECELTKELVKCHWECVKVGTGVEAFQDPELLSRFVHHVLQPWYEKEKKKRSPRYGLMARMWLNPSDVLVEWLIACPDVFKFDNLHYFAENPNPKAIDFVLNHKIRKFEHMVQNPSLKMVEYVLEKLHPDSVDFAGKPQYKRVSMQENFGEEFLLALLRRGDVIIPTGLIQFLAESDQVVFKIE